MNERKALEDLIEAASPHLRRTKGESRPNQERLREAIKNAREALQSEYREPDIVKDRFDFEYALSRILPEWSDEQYRMHKLIWDAAHQSEYREPDIEGLAHELFPAYQLREGEGITDAVDRAIPILQEAIRAGRMSDMDDGTLLIRCPVCKRENWAPSVSSGICAWCGYDIRVPVDTWRADTTAPKRPHVSASDDN